MADPAERRHAAALMRVNHAGEIAAQALYHGQALFARPPALREHMLEARPRGNRSPRLVRATRRELGSRTSLLNPLWYAGRSRSARSPG